MGKQIQNDPSKPLANSRHEAFALEIASGKSQADAYRTIYPNSQKWSDSATIPTASRLATSSNVSARVQWLKEQSATKAIITREQVMQELAKIAIDEPVNRNKIKALELCGKELGMFRDANGNIVPVAIYMDMGGKGE